MWEDCAFRPDSPERNGVEGYANNGGLDDLSVLVDKGEAFYCHQGMRKPVRWRHPSGAVIDGHDPSYDPPIVLASGVSVPHKASGIPADICAGWFARYSKSRTA
jgi:hypothetical protein